MSNYLFVSPTPRFYPDIVGPDGSLIAWPGDVCEFENPPTDGLWSETDAPVNDKSGRIWPPRPAAPEPVAEPEAAPVSLDPPSLFPNTPEDGETV